MWMPSDIRRKILQYFFENGVLVVSRVQSAMHEELGCLNIYPFQIGRSFTDKGLCKRSYAWAHAYFTLTDKGVEYLRNYFGLPADASPITLIPRKTEVIDRHPDHASRGGRGRGGHFDRPGRGNFHGPRRPQQHEHEEKKAE